MPGLTVQSVLHKALPGCFKAELPFQIDSDRSTSVLGFRPLGRHRRFLLDILTCRTAALGWIVERCVEDGYERFRYHSCKHRSCPMCRTTELEKFLARQRSRVLDVEHHHVVFTVPHELNELFFYNFKLFAGLMFKAASQSILCLSRNTSWLGGKPGVMLAFHSWGQQLQVHPHLHGIVTSGGLDDKGRWVKAKRRDLFPLKALETSFRGRFLGLVRKALRKGHMKIPPRATTAGLLHLVGRLHRTHWNTKVFPRDHALGVINYLARYLRGGPIGNKRLLSLDNDTVTFATRDTRSAKYELGDNTPNGECTMPLRTFVKRLLNHVPPKGFHAFRGFGLYACSNSKKCLARAREALGMPEREPAVMPSFAHLNICPHCGGQLSAVAEVEGPLKRYRKGRYEPDSARAPPLSPSSKAS